MIAAVATAATLFVLIALAGAFAALWAVEGEKMLAALKGRSWSAAATPTMASVTVRFSRPLAASRPVRQAPAWRAAA